MILTLNLCSRKYCVHKRWFTNIVCTLEKPLIQRLPYCNVVEEYSVGKCNIAQLTRVVLQSSVVPVRLSECKKYYDF